MRFDLNKMVEFAKENAVGFNASYSESSDELELEIISAAKAECFYMKRVPTTDYFIEKWNEHVRIALSEQGEKE